MCKNIRLSEKNDMPILFFLWKWKLMTTSGVGLFIDGNARSERSYQRVRRLEQSGYIASHSNQAGRQYLWTLTNKGFATIEDYLPTLKEKGYKSESKRHDFIVSACHLGEWIHNKPNGVQMFSEQELRRLDEHEYPYWVPTPSIHRADGYWLVPSGEKFRTIALEVELHHQKHSKYRSIANFYKEFNKVFSVLWIVANPSLARTIQKVIFASTDKAADYHNFVSYRQFLRHGWQAQIEIGNNASSTIKNYLYRNCTENVQPVVVNDILDTRKCPYKSSKYTIDITDSF